MAADNDDRPQREDARLLAIAGRVEPSGRVVFSQGDEPALDGDIEPGVPGDPCEA